MAIILDGDIGVTAADVAATTLSINAGYGSNAAAYGCRAWVNFNGVGTVAIRGSGNVSSITDSGVGKWIINFTTAMPDVNYSGNVSARLTGGTAWVSANHTTAPLTTTFRLATVNNGAFYDSEYISASIFR